MDTAKIKELIAELEQDIEVKKQALQGLQKLLFSTNGHATVNVEGQMAQRDSMRAIRYLATDSYVDLAVKIIEANEGRPTPVMQIVEHIRNLRGNPHIERRSVEATLYRHIVDKGDSSRLVKNAPGIYGIRRFPREESAA